LIFSESLRDGAVEAVDALRRDGLSARIYSGDTPEATRRVSDQLGKIEALGGMTPEDKYQAVTQLAEQGAHVLMVGDGLNDTAALTQAHVSISPASALDASRAASDIVILGQSLKELPEAIRVSRSARRRVLENFAIAAGYNMIAIPIAVMGLATPLSAAIAMSASSITVLLNALRVR
jgi:Cu2+-exporting ATPase